MKKARIIALFLLLLLLAAGGVLFYRENQIQTWAQRSPASDKANSEDRQEQLEQDTPTNRNEEAAPEKTGDPETQESEEFPALTGMEVHFIDVGQGDATLIVADGEAMLIDGGRASCSSLIYTYLYKEGIRELRYLAVTHFHEDHAGGVGGAIAQAVPELVLVNDTITDADDASGLMNKLEKKGLSAEMPQPGDRYTLGGAIITVLGPLEHDAPDAAETDPNDRCLVLRVDYGETSFLFMADAQKAEEESLLQSGAELDADVLRVGHHGSDSSTEQAFLEAVDPEAVIISVGTQNEYGHPDESVLKRLKEQGVQLFRTDLQGDIVCYSDGVNCTFQTEKDTNADLYAPGAKSGNANVSGASDGAILTEGYILNERTMKFHISGCEAAQKISEHNKGYAAIEERESLLERGYVPCGWCRP